MSLSKVIYQIIFCKFTLTRDVSTITESNRLIFITVLSTVFALICFLYNEFRKQYRGTICTVYINLYSKHKIVFYAQIKLTPLVI